MKTNCYIKADNKKAYSHFKKNGYKLMAGKKSSYIDELFADELYSNDYGCRYVPTFNVYFVGGFESGAAFHKYMKRHGLLMK